MSQSDVLNKFVRHAGEWMRGDGPMRDIVISTRLRLARNVAGFNFLSRADNDMRTDIAEILTRATRKVPQLADTLHLEIDKLDELDRTFLVERHLISRQQAEGTGTRRVVFDPKETVALMINEEDHLRMQVMRSGLQLDAAWEQISAIDDAIGHWVEYAFHPKLGYLTACPTNVGTGIRVSVMLHLPALRLTSEIEKVGQAAKDLRLAIRGLHGEGTEALGDLFQISNQVTLGVSEQDILDEFRDEVIPKIVAYEQAARAALIKTRPQALDDKIYRAMGLLQNSRLMSSSEAMQCLSHVRMGFHAGRIREVDLQTINELFLHTQPAHLQKLRGARLNGEQRSIARAEIIRERLSRN